MAAENFFARWAKPKSVVDQAAAAQSSDPLAARESAIAPAPAPVEPPPAPPTMDDVASLTRDSDYAPFMARGVDQMVQRGAMKKLFADPHFNLMDGLDIYIGNYNTADPIPAAMLALLDHAKGVLDPLSMFEKPVMQLVSPLQLDAKLDQKAELEEESGLDPESTLVPDAKAPVTTPDPSDPPLLDRVNPSDQPMLEPAPSPLGALDAVPDAAIDVDADTDVDIDASPKKTFT
jgi:hypothetical protein